MISSMGHGHGETAKYIHRYIRYVLLPKHFNSLVRELRRHRQLASAIRRQGPASGSESESVCLAPWWGFSALRLTPRPTPVPPVQTDRSQTS